MNRKCRKLVKHLSAYIDGELSAPMKAAVEKHVATCSDCAERLSRWTTLSRRTAAGLKAVAGSSSPPAGIPARVMAEARARRAQLRTVLAFRRLSVGAAAALLAALVGGAVLFTQMRHEEQTLKRLVADQEEALSRAQKQLAEAQERHEKAISAFHFRMGELLERVERLSPRTVSIPTQADNL